MKRFALAIVSVLAIASIAVAVDLWDVPNEAASGQIKSCINSNNVTLEAAFTAQGTTNAGVITLITARSFTTTGELAVICTAYTPRFLGDMLYNVTSNCVWFAKATTTNDWILLN